MLHDNTVDNPKTRSDIIPQKICMLPKWHSALIYDIYSIAPRLPSAVYAKDINSPLGRSDTVL